MSNSRISFKCPLVISFISNIWERLDCLMIFSIRDKAFALLSMLVYSRSIYFIVNIIYLFTKQSRLSKSAEKVQHWLDERLSFTDTMVSFRVDTNRRARPALKIVVRIIKDILRVWFSGFAGIIRSEKIRLIHISDDLVLYRA